MDTDSSEEKQPITPDHFDKLHEALRESSARHSRLLMTFVLALLYLLITVASTTDLQLLLPDSGVKLPVLGVELPLLWFYFAAPALAFILHLSFMLHLLHHVRKLKAWIDTATEEQRVLLPSFFLNYTYSFKPKSINHWLMRVVQIVVLGFWPLILLLSIQIRFADYHSVPMTAWHFTVVFLDVFILIVYWYRIIDQRYLGQNYDRFREIWRLYYPKRVSGPPSFGRFVRIILGYVNPVREASVTYMRLFVLVLLASASCLAVVYMITTDRYWQNSWFLPRIDVPGATLVESPPSDVILHSYFSRGLSADSAWIDYADSIDLQWRDLCFADLSGCNLLRAALQNVRLNWSNLDGAELTGAHLDSAKLNGADLSLATLNGADLSFAELNGASMDDAELNGAFLYEAELNGAWLWRTQLNGAGLYGAELNGVSLWKAKLNGATLYEAELNGASLVDAELNGAFLYGAELNGADLTRAALNGANLFGAQLNGAGLYGARLSGSDLSSAWLVGAILSRSELKGAYLEQTRFRGGRLDADSVRGGYFISGIELMSTPYWEGILADSITILDNERREFYLDVIYAAQAYADTADTAQLNIGSDSAGFVKVRKLVACENTWVAFGLFRQTIGDTTLTKQLREGLLEHMSSSCPDSLEVVRQLLEDAAS